MKIATLSILTLTAFSIHAGYAKTREFKADIAAQKQITLLEAFREMASSVKSVFVPKAKPVKSVELSKDYNIHNHSIIASGRLDQFLGGVLAGKGEKFLSEARKNNICPIFLAAISMHESANGKSDFARNRNNVFGIYLRGQYHRFKNVDECIEFSAKLLAGRIYSKNPTIVGVQRIYCPVGADNDPKGLNKYWLSGVMDKMQKLWGKTIYLVDSKQ
jgi:hypothetical protein